MISECSQSQEVLFVGRIFNDKAELLGCINSFNVASHVSTESKQSTPTRVHLICSSSECFFKLTAGWRSKKGHMRIN